ncbi:MAG: hypothetical protein J6W52_12575 [Bacteroidaceae bacterium]|nr:hypothetical protein [Bacteroidaceae bacterium]
MIQLPNLVQDAPIVRMQNAVLVGTMKFTLDQFDLFFNAGNPAPTRLATQISEFRNSYGRLNAAYALTRESLLTGDISGLDEEGDQLYMGAKDTVEGARRMTYVVTRKQAGDRLWIFMKKYDVNVKENMIAEWSKLQQMTEEANASASLTADLATLGLTEMWARLTEVADQLRNKLTERSAEMPAQQAMKQAREAIYPEYRALIDLLKAYAMVDADTQRFDTLTATLNNNIDYVRIHAMKDGGSTVGQGGNSESNQNENQNENNGNNNNNQNDNENNNNNGNNQNENQNENNDNGNDNPNPNPGGDEPIED